jgi:hypothetical protein
MTAARTAAATGRQQDSSAVDQRWRVLLADGLWHGGLGPLTNDPRFDLIERTGL